MDKLQSVQLKNFKRIVDAPFDIDEINVLVGGNNSGKSSIIQGLHFAIGLLQSIKLVNGKIPIAISLNPSQLIYSPSDDAYALGVDGRLLEDQDKAISIEFVLNSGGSCKISARKGRNKNIAITIENVEIAEKLANIEKPFSIFSPGLAGITKRESYVSDGVLLRTLARGDANLILRNILLRLFKNKTQWISFIDDLQEVFPRIEINVSFNDDSDEFIDVQIALSSGSLIPFELVGTGVLQAIQILSYIHKFSPSLIVLDEPDSHLHPNNQRAMCSLLKRISKDRDIQVLLTTHSRHVVDALSSACQLLWVRNGEIAPASTDEEIGILLDLGALDIKERIGATGSLVIILTEDENPIALKALLDSSGFATEDRSILPYYGVTNPKQLRPLLNIIKKSNPKAKVILHRDRDYLTDAEAEEWESRSEPCKSPHF